MTPGQIWTHLYDKGIREGIDNFNSLQRHLYYFIDFVYLVEMEGEIGFLYNNSPSAPGEDDFKPYIASLHFFHQHRLAALLQAFNDKYQEGFKALEKAQTLSAEEFYEKFGISEIKEQAEQMINKVVSQEQATVLAWIEQNTDVLQEGFNSRQIE